MNRKYFISNAVLWAAAILASAIVGAPPVLSALLLPGLAACSFLVTGPRFRAPECRTYGEY